MKRGEKMNMKDFIDPNYEVPNKQSNYMKWQNGENRFRFLCSPIMGWETWTETPEGGRKPIRHPMDIPFTVDEVEDGDVNKIKHFWAAVVWDYREEKIQILEITQKGIQKSIRALAKDEDWGSPLSYDIVVTKSGEKLETEYQVNPKPAKKMDEGILRLYQDMDIHLEALYSGDDPFNYQKNEEKIDIDEIQKELDKK